jgi:hypothetical protein
MADDPPEVTAASQSPLAEQTDERTERAAWTSSIAGANIVTLVAGIWLAVSAAAINYPEPAAPVICGALIVVLSVLRMAVPAVSRTLALATVGAGALTAVSAFLLGDAPGETLNQALIGLAVIVLALISLAAEAERPRASRP